MTLSKNQPKYGGIFRTRTQGDGPNLDPNDPTGVSQSFLQLFFNRLVKADMSFTTAFQGKQNFLKLLVANDLASSTGRARLSTLERSWSSSVPSQAR
jgi:hypothetical protein